MLAESTTRDIFALERVASAFNLLVISCLGIHVCYSTVTVCRDERGKKKRTPAEVVCASHRNVLAAAYYRPIVWSGVRLAMNKTFYFQWNLCGLILRNKLYLAIIMTC